MTEAIRTLTSKLIILTLLRYIRNILPVYHKIVPLGNPPPREKGPKKNRVGWGVGSPGGRNYFYTGVLQKKTYSYSLDCTSSSS